MCWLRPDDAISTMAGVSTVYVIEDGKARQQQVTLGARKGTVVEIVEGLKGDEIVATSNVNQLATGTSVRTGQAVSEPEGRGNGANGRRGGQGRGREGSQPMKLAEISVKRPVFAIMMTTALIVLGSFSYKDLGLDLMPKTDQPVVNVQVQLPGASAEEVETQITKRDRGSREHHQRHRRTAGELPAGQCQCQHHLHARARHRSRDAGRPRQGRHNRRSVPA